MQHRKIGQVYFSFCDVRRNRGRALYTIDSAESFQSAATSNYVFNYLWATMTVKSQKYSLRIYLALRFRPLKQYLFRLYGIRFIDEDGP